MLEQMKRRKLRQLITEINGLATNRNLTDSQARANIILQLSKVIPVKRVSAAKAAQTAPAVRRATKGEKVMLRYGSTVVHVTPEQYNIIAGQVRIGQKIQAIREIRTITGLGLKEAKDLVEGDINLRGATGIAPPLTYTRR